MTPTLLHFLQVKEVEEVKECTWPPHSFTVFKWRKWGTWRSVHDLNTPSFISIEGSEGVLMTSTRFYFLQMKEVKECSWPQHSFTFLKWRKWRKWVRIRDLNTPSFSSSEGSEEGEGVSMTSTLLHFLEVGIVKEVKKCSWPQQSFTSLKWRKWRKWRSAHALNTPSLSSSEGSEGSEGMSMTSTLLNSLQVKEVKEVTECSWPQHSFTFLQWRKWRKWRSVRDPNTPSLSSSEGS